MSAVMYRHKRRLKLMSAVSWSYSGLVLRRWFRSTNSCFTLVRLVRGWIITVSGRLNHFIIQAIETMTISQSAMSTSEAGNWTDEMHKHKLEMGANVFSISFPPIPNGSFLFDPRFSLLLFYSLPIPLYFRSHSRTASNISSDNK